MEPTPIECDVLVVGSGAGGMSAAITARSHGLNVIIAEKEPLYGGTTARSGGVLWIPANSINAKTGVRDSLQEARTYLQHETGNFFDAARIDAFLENGDQMVRWFEANTAVRFLPNEGLPDYHPDAPGAKHGGRSIVAAPFSGQELGASVANLRPPLKEITFVGMMFNISREVQHFFRATKSLTSALYVARRLIAHSYEMLRYGRAMRLTNGNALAARLARTVFDLQIPLWLNSPVTELVFGNGRVVGARVSRDGGVVEVRARRGVVLAAGGFPVDPARRKELFPHAPTGAEHYSPAPPGNTGDGLRLGETAGGTVQSDLPNAGAWIPVSRVPYRDGTGHFPHLIDRYKPGIIAVLKSGRRFVNEANSYHDVGQAMIRESEGEASAWLICDQKTLSQYGLGYVKPFPVPHFHHLRSGYLKKGRSLRALALAAGIDPAGLEEAVRSYNGAARNGADPVFGRGENAYNRYLGDAEHTPNPNVAPIEHGPFYAVKIVMGDLGTFAGLRTSATAQVLDKTGRPIPGLFAVGNDAASIMGGNYPGGGITLGPAMTFGFIVGRHLATISDINGENAA